MTILGKHPEGVIEYEYDGVTYYFWYYDKLDIDGYLLEHSDFDYSDFTLRDLIEVLEIQAE